MLRQLEKICAHSIVVNFIASGVPIYFLGHSLAKDLLVWIVMLLAIAPLIEAPMIAGEGITTNGWTVSRNSPINDYPNESSYTLNGNRLLWTFATKGEVKSTPAIANGCVFFGSRDGMIYCVNSSTGKQIWTFSTGEAIESSPAIEGTKLYISSEDGRVYCINTQTGIQIWKATIGGYAKSSPYVANDRLFIGSGKPAFFCLNATDGNLIWKKTMSERIESSPTLNNELVYIASNDFHVYAFNQSDGLEIWRTHTGSTVSSPVAYMGNLFIGSSDGAVLSLNATSGDINWQYQTSAPIISSPTVAYGCIYIGSEDNNIYCINATTGQRLWTARTNFWVCSSPIVVYGNVYIGSEDYNIYCFDALSGAKKWSYETGGYVDSTPVIENRTLYVGSSDYRLYAFRLENSYVEKQTIKNEIIWPTIALDIALLIIVGFTVYTLAHSFLKRVNEEKSLKPSEWIKSHSDACFVVILAVVSGIFYLNLSGGVLWVSDEQTYAQWAYHMVKTGDYLTPWAFGDTAVWIGKPPLNIWFISVAYQFLGVSNFSTRVISAIFGSMSLIATYYIGKLLYNKFTGFLSALTLATFTGFYTFSTHAMTDIPFVFFTISSFYFFLRSEKIQEQNKYSLLSGLFFGLALLTKQIAALIIPITIFFYIVLTRKSIRLILSKNVLIFIIAGFLMFMPWLIYMYVVFTDQFWQWFIVYSNFTRALSPIEGHAGGYLFYFDYLAEK